MVHGSVDKYFKEIQRGRDRQNNLSKEVENKAKSHVITLDQHKQLKELKERQNNYSIYPTVQSDNYFFEYTDPKENEFNIIIHDIKNSRQFRTKFNQHIGLPLMLYHNGTMFYESGVIR